MQTFSSERAFLDGSACDAILLVLLSIYQLGSGSISKSTTALQSTELDIISEVFKGIRMTKRD